MSDTNIVVLKGRVVRNAELKFTQTGTPCTSFSLAVNETTKKGDEYENRPNFFDVTLWGNYGKAIVQYLSKGREVLVTGRLKQDRWEKDGKANSKVLVVASDVELLREPKGNQGAGQSEQTGQSAAPQKEADGKDSSAPEDIPF